MTTNSDLAVEAVGLTKAFGQVRAVDGVDIAVPTGSVYGLLGPNGAGKTTTVRMLVTLVKPDAGAARVFGHDVATSPEEVRRRIALTGQFASVDEELTGAENLRLQSRLLGLNSKAAARRTDELLDGFDLGEAARRQVKSYSGGMRRRLDVAASIVVIPDLLFLDEPTTGLDPPSSNAVWAIVRRLAEQGTTVLLTTQYLDEADQLCDRIAVVDHGRIVADDSPSRLKTSVGSGVLHVRLADPGHRLVAGQVIAAALRAPVDEQADPAVLRVRVPADSRTEDTGERAMHALTQLYRAEIPVSAFELDQPSLDEVFLDLTGHPTEKSDTKEKVA
ncbi:MAG: ATP-binding cassette domain-containing protein [Nocardioidaceae bacterium]